MAKLSDKQEIFCIEYLFDLNATQAAIRAGYSKKTAKVTGSENLTKPDIAARIAVLNKSRLNKVKMEADYVLQRLVEIDKMDIAEILNDDFSVKPLSEWPDSWRQTLSGMDISEIWGDSEETDTRVVIGMLKKMKWPDKIKNLELLGKHVTVGAFKEVFNHNYKGEVRSITHRIVDPKSRS